MTGSFLVLVKVIKSAAVNKVVVQTGCSKRTERQLLYIISACLK